MYKPLETITCPADEGVDIPPDFTQRLFDWPLRRLFFASHKNYVMEIIGTQQHSSLVIAILHEGGEKDTYGFKLIPNVFYSSIDYLMPHHARIPHGGVQDTWSLRFHLPDRVQGILARFPQEMQEWVIDTLYTNAESIAQSVEAHNQPFRVFRQQVKSKKHPQAVWEKMLERFPSHQLLVHIESAADATHTFFETTYAFLPDDKYPYLLTRYKHHHEGVKLETPTPSVWYVLPAGRQETHLTREAENLFLTAEPHLLQAKHLLSFVTPNEKSVNVYFSTLDKLNPAFYVQILQREFDEYFFYKTPTIRWRILPLRPYRAYLQHKEAIPREQIGIILDLER